MAKRMLDLFCGRFGWSRAFAARGWECVGIDLVAPPEIPEGCFFVQADILKLTSAELRKCYAPDFICASSPCEQFSVHGMKHFHPNPAYPTLGIELFNHTRALCEESGVPYVMENVRAAQEFVGWAQGRSAPFFLWGSGVPPLLPKRCAAKNITTTGSAYRKAVENGSVTRMRAQIPYNRTSSKSKARASLTAAAATIPSELAAAVVDYAERICAFESAVA